ncbi:MAG: hypothetical protein GOVbin709_31 [Prokaryotic dsDNA virus sp.]|nr:MAG: hypothetical protein GOVbin709_31 [Prokaryotic dsDNA virus sp.]|tara:strand:+ start:2004 stop:10223 length:8220 start_codon:yes stop_codon:yes gene_type:complete
MVRAVKDKYGAWLVGYYDDFNGARAVPSDFNSPDNTFTGVYTHAYTHFGNPLNGEATLNPRFRWSYYDRLTIQSAYGAANAATQPYGFAPDTMRFLHNKGNFEWLSYDGNRNYSAKQMGRAKLQYPDGHTNTNFFRTFPRTNSHPQPGDAAQIICNGHNTLGRYVIPTGDIDSSFGRQSMTGYGDNTTYKAGTAGKNSWVRLATMEGSGSGINGNTSTLTMVRRAHLAGRWMGETHLYTDAGISNGRPKNIFAPLESPSGMPFLCVQQYNRTGSDSTPDLPTIYYDGDLHSRDTHDILTFRLAVRSFNGAGKVTPKVTIKAGYSSTSSPALGSFENGLTGNPVVSFDLALGSTYDTCPLLYENSSTRLAYNNNDSWLDVDVHLNYDTQKFEVYRDGTKILANQSFTGSNIKAEDMYGWQIFMHPTSGSNNVSSTLLLDRAALYRPLTDDPTERDIPPLTNMKMQTTINGFSNCQIELIDDADDYDSIDDYGFNTTDYAHNFTSVMRGNKLNDWGLILFAGGGRTGYVDVPHIDRPIWRGVVSSININQKRRGRVISINATDTLTAMEKQIPLWELGQNKDKSTENQQAYWAYDAQGLMEVMDMGTSVLKQFTSKIGREFSNDYENIADQRTQLGSGMPIQMYNNEDSFGPNSIWEDYEGMGIDYFYKDNTGLRLVLSGNPNMGSSGNITLNYSGRAALDGTTVAITAHHSINSAGEIVTYSATDPYEVLTVAIGTGSGQLNWTDEYSNLCYVGKYVGPSIPHDYPEFEFWNFPDPVSNVQHWNNYADFIANHPATYENGRASISGIRMTNHGWGYTVANGYYTTVDGEKVSKGTISMPAPENPNTANPGSDPHWEGETATAEWEGITPSYSLNAQNIPFVNQSRSSWYYGNIGKVTITNPGKGYRATGANETLLDNWFNTDRINNADSKSNDGIQSYPTSGLALQTVKKQGWGAGTQTLDNLVGGDYDDLVAQSPNGDGVYHCSLPWVDGQIPDSYDPGDGSMPTNGNDNIITNETNASGTGNNLVIKLKFTGGTTDTVVATVINGGHGYAIDDVIKCRLAFKETSSGDGHFCFVTLRVTAIASDFDAEFEYAQQASTDYLTFFFSTESGDTTFPINPGDGFVISNTETSTNLATSAGAKKAIRGRHIAKTVRKVINYHGNPLAADKRQRFLWQVQTYTPLPDGWTDGTIGDFDLKEGLLNSSYWGGTNQQLSWSKERKMIITSPTPASHTESIKERPVHAKWMQDLPHSLYFRYHFAQIQYTPQRSFDLVAQVDAGATDIEITQATYNAIPNAGVAVLDQAQAALTFEAQQNLRDFFIYRCKYYDGSKWWMGGCKYVALRHPLTVNAWSSAGSFGAVPTQIHVIQNRDAYKHLWLLWADMRNDGTADADGGLRKKNFGLKSPVTDNYSLQIQFDDQVDESGNYKNFTTLKMNDDYDLWTLDSTNDPSTGGAYSKPLDYDNMIAVAGNDVSITTASGKSYIYIADANHGLSVGDYVGLINFGTVDGVYKVGITGNSPVGFGIETTLSASPVASGTVEKHFFAKTTGSDVAPAQYQDWENKGGALMVVDTSKFFNLNTIANKGMVNQEGGGQTDLGDYYAVGVGDPVLIDSYYRNAASTSLTTDNDYHKHTNLNKLVSGKTSLADGLNKGEFWLEPLDTTIFDDNGIGRLLGSKIETENRSEWFFQWNGKIASDITASSVTVTTPAENDQHFVITKSGATFISDGVKKGAYVQNTSKPLVRGVGNSWRTGDAQDHYYRVKKVVSETVLHIERVIYYSFEKALNTEENSEGLTSGLRVRDSGLTADEITDGWATGHNLKIPKQLFNVMLDSVTIATTDNVWTQSGIESALVDQMRAFVSSGGTAHPHIKTNIDESVWPVLTLYNSVANEYAYRLMMKIDGKYLNLNSGTFYNSDKMRALWNMGIMENWLAKTKITNMFDINNIPITDKMTTYNTNSEQDSYGSVLETNSKTLMRTVVDTQKAGGVGFNNSLFTSFSWLVGRDNRLEFRPKYNSGYSFTRNNVNVTDFAMSQKERVEYVRCLFDNGKQFVDFPSPAIGDTTTWKIIEHDNVISRVEALGLAEQEYNSRKKNPISLQIEPLPLFAPQDEDVMLDGGKYGYIADAQVASQGDGDDSANTAWCWTIQGTGGVIFPGMVSGLDGNMGNTVTSSTMHTRYGDSDINTGTVAHNDNYTTYGARSVSYAVQVVHVGKDIPKVSADTGEKLRVVVALKTLADADKTTDIDSAIFQVYLIDAGYDKVSASGSVTLNGYISSNNHYTSVECKHNGFYEIDVPSSYHSSGKIVISFNADYCRDLLRTRCGDINAQSSGVYTILTNGQTQIGGATAESDSEISLMITNGQYNNKSIFPLGCRSYPSLKGGMGAHRSLWYAPALHIVDDLNYVPGTFVKYTDAGLDIDNLTMVVTDVDWQVEMGKERVLLRLSEDESTSSKGIMDYIFAPPKLPNPTTSSGGNNSAIAPSPQDNLTTEPGSEYSPGDPVNNNWTEADGGSGGSGGSFSPDSINMNSFDRGTYMAIMKNLIGGGSEFTAQYANNILGQTKTSTTPSSMRGMTGPLRVHPTQGSATSNGNGFDLPGKGKDEGVGAGEIAFSKKEIEHQVEVEIKTPKDAISDEINIMADVKLPSSANTDRAALLKIHAKCLETGAEFSETLSVPTGTKKANMQLSSTTSLSGAGTSGNTLVFTFSRTPGIGNDSANYSTLSVTNMDINFKRAAFNADNRSNVFLPYR